MIKKITEMIDKFEIPGEFVDFKMFKSGLINTTCLVTMQEDGEEKKYVLQKINTNVFKKPVEVMDNIANVTGFIRDKYEEAGYDASRRVLNFKQAPDGNYYVVDDNNGYWRMYDFIDNSITYDVPNEKVLEGAGRAFGEFQTMLSDYPSHELFETIPNFHNTPKRYEAFKEVLEKDPVGRKNGVESVIKEYLRFEHIACQMQTMLDNGALPLRVTHNDTKLNNVLVDEETNEPLCVIDLDTVMPGLVGHDFGDAMRFASNTQAEDSTDLANVRIDLNKYRAFTKGFLDGVGDSLTKTEMETLSLGALTMTIECGLRFLTDYIDGDNYFGTKYPEHNLDRAKCQLALAEDMLRKFNEMRNIVEECANERDSY